MAAARVCWSRRTVGALRNGNALPFGAVYACHSARIEARLPNECAQVVHPCATVAVRQQRRPLDGAVLKLKSYPVAAGRLDGRETTVPRGEVLVHLSHIVGHDAPPSSSPLDVLSNADRTSCSREAAVCWMRWLERPLHANDCSATADHHAPGLAANLAAKSGPSLVTLADVVRRRCDNEINAPSGEGRDEEKVVSFE